MLLPDAVYAHCQAQGPSLYFWRNEGSDIMRRRQIDGWSIRWDDARAKSARDEGWWSDETLADLLPRVAEDTPELLLIADGDIRLTAGGCHRAASRLAGWLRPRTKRGQVVSFIMPNWHEAAIVYFAATYCGLVANPILPSLRDHDLRFILKDCGSRVVFVPESFNGFPYAEMLRRVAAELEDPPEIVVVRGEGKCRFADIVSQSDPVDPLALDPDSVRMVMYTSGTTGRPKGVLHTHNSLHALLRQIGEHWLVEPGDRFLVPSPLSHIGGSIYVFEAPLLLGSSATLMERWDPAAALGLMAREDVTHMAGATPFLEHLLAAAKAADERLPALKLFICGGASVPPKLIEEAADWFDQARVSRVYGSTEVPVTTVGALERRNMPEAAHSDGRAGCAQILIGDQDEIRTRGPQMLAGYIDEADEAAAFDEEGFYRTGDQGRLDSQGFLAVTGRIKDLIIRNGENIAPKEIEDLLIGHGDIADIAVVGVPDPRTGERAFAVIVPCGDARPNVDALARHLAAQGVAKFKFPEAVEFRDRLPRNDAGKVLKHVLREELTG